MNSSKINILLALTAGIVIIGVAAVAILLRKNPAGGEIFSDFSNFSESDEGMSAFINLRAESEKTITIKIFDANGKEVASCDGENETGFNGDNFTCDQFGDLGATLTSIYMPKKGYFVRFYYGEKANTPVDLFATVNLLNPDGDETASGFYYTRSTIESGEALGLDLISGVTKNKIGKLASAKKYPSLTTEEKSYSNDWELDFSNVKKPADVVVLDNIGDTAVIGFIGKANPDVIEWLSHDESVVTVENGVLTAVGHGRTVISAYASDASGKSQMFHVKVTLTSSTVEFDDIELEAGRRDLIMPRFDSDLVTEVGIDYDYDESAGVIIIDDDVVFGLAGGEIEVTGTAPGGAAGKFKVTVEGGPPVPARGISFTSPNVKIRVNETVELETTVYPENATNQWREYGGYDKSIIEIPYTIGSMLAIVGLREGVTEITMTSRDGGHKATATITVER